MTFAPVEPNDVVSGALVDGVAFEIPIPDSTLAALLSSRHAPQSGVTLSPGSRPAALVCEMWRVREGRLMLGGLEPSDLADRLGAFTGGVAGAWAGATLALWSGLLPRSETPAAAVRGGMQRGFEWGAALGRSGARGLGARLALPLYHEMMIGVPDVHLEGYGPSVTAVLSMITDSRLAQAIDVRFGYGYDKRMGIFGGDWAHRFEVVANGTGVFSFCLDRGASGEVSGEPCNWGERWAQPLFGLGASAKAISQLVRDVESGGAECIRITGTIEANRQAALPLPDELFPLSARVEGVVFRNLPFRITLPQLMKR